MLLKPPFCGSLVLFLLSAVCNAQQPISGPAFAIADIHDSPHRAFPFSNGGNLKGDRYYLRQSTIVEMIAKAYGVDPEMIQAGPSWLEMRRFDVAAKADPGTPPTALKLMLQSLLADRFKLVMHKGEAPMPAFLLTAPGGKSTMKPSVADDDTPQQCLPDLNAPTAGGVPLLVISCTAMSADELATFLHDAAGGYLTQPVVNQTGLNGKWDFTVKWTARGQLAKAGADGISIFDAVSKQLGLKLDLETAPRPVWIVDSVNEEPSPNSPDVAKKLPEPPPARFEVATIKPSKSSEQPMGRLINGQMTTNAMSLKFLITFAWDLNANDSNMIVNAPKWLDENKFDMVAKAAPPEPVPGKRAPQISVDDEEFRQMLRALLIERFKMQVHMEDRPIDAYKLIADHPKMKAADPKSRTRCVEGPGPGGKDPRLANPAMNMLITCQNMTPKQMGEEFAHFAAGYVYSPVRDATELKGAYDFTLSWSSANQTILKPPPTPPSSGSQQQTSDPDGAMTFYDAVDKQLGLKLVKEKRPVPVLIIESIQETPTEN